MPGVREEDIRLRAYEIWVAEGRPHGRDHEHWLMAIAQLKLHAAPAKTNPAQPVKTDVVAAADRAVKKPVKAKAAAVDTAKPAKVKAEPKAKGKAEALEKPSAAPKTKAAPKTVSAATASPAAKSSAGKTAEPEAAPAEAAPKAPAKRAAKPKPAPEAAAAKDSSGTTAKSPG